MYISSLLLKVPENVHQKIMRGVQSKILGQVGGKNWK